VTATSCALADNTLKYNYLSASSHGNVQDGANCGGVSHGATITFTSTCQQSITIQQWCRDANGGPPCGGTVKLIFSNVISSPIGYYHHHHHYHHYHHHHHQYYHHYHYYHQHHQHHQHHHYHYHHH